MSCLAFCNMRTGSWKCGIYFSRVHSLLLLILHLSQVRSEYLSQDKTFGPFWKSQSERYKVGRYWWNLREIGMEQSIGELVSEAVETGRTALRETSRNCLELNPALFDCSFQIRLDLALTAAALTHKFTISIFALPTRSGSHWHNSGSCWALRECGKENQTLRRVSFLAFSSFQTGKFCWHF